MRKILYVTSDQGRYGMETYLRLLTEAFVAEHETYLIRIDSVRKLVQKFPMLVKYSLVADVVHFQAADEISALLCPILRGLGIRSVISLPGHDILVGKGISYGQRRRKIGNMVFLMGTFFANRLIAHSLYVSNHLPTFLRSKCEVVYHGLPATSLPEMPEEDFLLVAKALIPKNGIDLLLRSFVIVKARRPSTRLIVTGDGSQKQDLMKLAAKLHLEDSVEFLGFVTRDEVIKLFQSSKLVALPSREEAFGLVIIEAFREKKPVVAFGVGGIPELINNGVTGYVIPPFDISAFANALVDLLNQDSRRMMMGENAYGAFLNRFTLDRMKSQTIDVYFDKRQPVSSLSNPRSKAEPKKAIY